jgi:hypothetical protein
MLTCFPDIFLNNPHIDKVIKKDQNGNVSTLMKKYFKITNVKVTSLLYGSYNKNSDRDERIPEKHIAYLMCDIAKVYYPDVLKPNFYLTEIETRKGKLYDNQICIQSSGKGARHYMQNKDWYPEKFAEVVEALKNKYTIIQIGSTYDYPLPSVIDMKGKTGIRETAALLANSKFFIGLDSFPMHLARAVNCRSIIIYGGRARPDQTGYDYNINLYSPVSCSPCWYWNFCPNDKMCMKQILASDVIEAVEKLDGANNSHIMSDKCNTMQAFDINERPYE